jgi:hypothetical protein
MLSNQGFKRHSLFASTALIVFGFFAISTAYGADPQCYNRASLQGDYAFITNYGDNVARTVGWRYYDGKGNFTGSFVINEPTAGSTTGERTIVSGTETGTYTVNCDGTGVITRVDTLSGSTTAAQTDDFVISGAMVIQNPRGPFFPGELIATALEDAGRVPSPIVSSGLFVTHKQTRRPDRQPSQ